jgi:hypothetical protein
MLSLLGTIAPASAALYDLNATTFDGFTITSQFTTSDFLNAAGGYDILSINGTVFNGADTFAIGALENNAQRPFASVSTSGLYVFDNNYFATGTLPFDNAGLLFTFGSQGYEGNVYQANSGNGLAFVTTAPVGLSAGSWNSERAMSTYSVAAVPEPGTYAMMLAGLGLMGFIARRKLQDLP